MEARCQHGTVLVRALCLAIGVIGSEGLWSSGIEGDPLSDIWEQKALLSRRPHLEGRMQETEPQVQGRQAVKSKQRLGQASKVSGVREGTPRLGRAMSLGIERQVLESDRPRWAPVPILPLGVG